MSTASPITTAGLTNASAMPCPSTGEKLPDVTSPTVLAVDDHSALGSRRAAAFGGDADELALDARRRARPIRACLPAELGLVEGDHPRQAGLQRRDAGTELVPVERQPGLEPQRVACAEPGRLHAGVDDRRPQRLGRLGRDGDLEPGLTGVAGAGDDARRRRPMRRSRPGSGRPPPASGQIGRPAACASGPCTASTARPR